MYYYIKMIGEDPIIIDSKEKIHSGYDKINVKAEDLFFVTPMQTQQGHAMIPVSALDNGLSHTDIIIMNEGVTIFAELKVGNPFIGAIDQVRQAKSGIITPQKPKLELI